MPRQIKNQAREVVVIPAEDVPNMILLGIILDGGLVDIIPWQCADSSFIIEKTFLTHPDVPQNYRAQLSNYPLIYKTHEQIMGTVEL